LKARGSSQCNPRSNEIGVEETKKRQAPEEAPNPGSALGEILDAQSPNPAVARVKRRLEITSLRLGCDRGRGKKAPRPKSLERGDDWRGEQENTRASTSVKNKNTLKRCKSVSSGWTPSEQPNTQRQVVGVNGKHLYCTRGLKWSIETGRWHWDKHRGGGFTMKKKRDCG